MSLRKLLLAVCLFPIALCGKTFETSSFKDIAAEVNKDTLVLLDIDCTLILTDHHLGYYKWTTDFVQDFIQKGMTEEQALDFENCVWGLIQSKVPVHAVDHECPAIVSAWQNEGISVMGLTARTITEITTSHKQLASVNIDLNKNVLCAKNVSMLLSEQPIAYDNGILFCTPQNKKSTSLLAFLKEIGVTPKRVVFVDDRWEHVRDVEQAMAGSGIEFVGVRFSGADLDMQGYDREIAELQWDAFPELISNEEARRLLHKSESLR